MTLQRLRLCDGVPAGQAGPGAQRQTQTALGRARPLPPCRERPVSPGWSRPCRAGHRRWHPQHEVPPQPWLKMQIRSHDSHDAWISYGRQVPDLLLAGVLHRSRLLHERRIKNSSEFGTAELPVPSAVPKPVCLGAAESQGRPGPVPGSLPCGGPQGKPAAAGGCSTTAA